MFMRCTLVQMNMRWCDDVMIIQIQGRLIQNRERTLILILNVCFTTHHVSRLIVECRLAIMLYKTVSLLTLIWSFTWVDFLRETRKLLILKALHNSLNLLLIIIL